VAGLFLGEQGMNDRYDIPEYDPAILRIADELKSQFLPEPSYKIGDIVSHQDGRSVRIVGGTFWVGDGPLRRLSNFWTWHPVDAAGAQNGDPESGYGSDLIDPTPSTIPAHS
jgi:hypothetical protein